MYTILTLSIASALVVLPATYDAEITVTSDTTPILVARRGADDPPGDVRQGRGKDDPPGDVRRSRGADDPPGDLRRSRGRDDAVTPGGQGMDNPPGDMRRGRGRDDPLNHG